MKIHNPLRCESSVRTRCVPRCLRFCLISGATPPFLSDPCECWPLVITSYITPIGIRRKSWILSLIIWTLTLLVTFKYLMFVMRANDQGEGGILALLSLAVAHERLGCGSQCCARVRATFFADAERSAEERFRAAIFFARVFCGPVFRLSRSRWAFLRVSSGAFPFRGCRQLHPCGGPSRPMAMACSVERAPCSPLPMASISSGTIPRLGSKLLYLRVNPLRAGSMVFAFGIPNNFVSPAAFGR
jgi:potassium transporter